MVTHTSPTNSIQLLTTPPKNPESSIQNLFGIFSHIETQLFSRNLIFCFPYNFFYAKAKQNEIELNFMKLSSMHNFIHHFWITLLTFASGKLISKLASGLTEIRNNFNFTTYTTIIF